MMILPRCHRSSARLFARASSPRRPAASRRAARAVPAHAAFLVVLAIGLLAPPLPAQLVTEEARAPAAYDASLIEARVLFPKTEFLVGEPIFFDVELRNNSLMMREVRFSPFFTGDLRCVIALPGEAPRLYRGTDPPGFTPSETHTVLPGERRLFHFRIQFSDDPARPHPTNLFFYEPTEAELQVRLRWRVGDVPQEFVARPVRLGVVEPAARNAEALQLLLEPATLRAIQRERAEPEDFRRLENLLTLYRDTAYAPHLAYVLANGYLVEAMKRRPADRRLLLEAVKAYKALLQVVEVPYIRELAHYNLARAYVYLGDNEAFAAWYERYLVTFGDEGRFNYERDPARRHYVEVIRQIAPQSDEFWFLYP